MAPNVSAATLFLPERPQRPVSLAHVPSDAKEIAHRFAEMPMPYLSTPSAAVLARMLSSVLQALLVDRTLLRLWHPIQLLFPLRHLQLRLL